MTRLDLLADGAPPASLADAPSPGAVLEKIAAVPRNRTAPDQWEAQILARILTRATVILVAPELDPELPRSMHLLHAVSLEEAVETARKICGREKAVISVIPDGVSVIVTQK